MSAASRRSTWSAPNAIGGGNVTFAGGTLQYSASNNQDVSGQIFNSTAAMAIDTNGATNVVYASGLDVSNTAGLNKLGAGSLELDGSNLYQGGTTVTAGTLTIGGAGTLGPSAVYGNGISIAGGALMNFNTTAAQTLVGVISGSGALAQSGSASLLTVSGSNSYSGGTTISGGTLYLGTAAASVGSGSVSVTGSGTFEMFNFATLTVANNFTLNNGSIFKPDGHQTLTGTITIGSSGGAIYSNFGGTGGFKPLEVSGPITGSGPLTLSSLRGGYGQNYIDLNVASPGYTGTASLGDATANQIEVFVDNTNALQHATVNINNNANTMFGQATTNFGALEGSGSLALNYTGTNPMTLAVGGNGDITVFSGIISGSGGLTMQGPGQLNLANFNTYTGGTIVSGGSLQASINTALGTGALAVNGGTLDLAGNTVLVPSFSGAAGTVTSSLSGGTLNVTQSIATTFGGTMTDGLGQLALDLEGGTLTLSGTNTYTGGTLVNNAELILTKPSAIEDGTNVTVGDLTQFPAPIIPSSPVSSQAAAASAVAPVPEPGTLALLAAGAVIGVVALRRRKPRV